MFVEIVLPPSSGSPMDTLVRVVAGRSLMPWPNPAPVVEPPTVLSATVTSLTSFMFPTFIPCHPGALDGSVLGARSVSTSLPTIRTLERSVVMPLQSCPPNVLS